MRVKCNCNSIFVLANYIIYYIYELVYDTSICTALCTLLQAIVLVQMAVSVPVFFSPLDGLEKEEIDSFIWVLNDCAH